MTTYDQLVRIALVAKRWEANNDPKMAYIRALARHNYLHASFQYWAERGCEQEAWRHLNKVDREFDIAHHNASGRAKAYPEDGDHT